MGLLQFLQSFLDPQAQSVKNEPSNERSEEAPTSTPPTSSSEETETTAPPTDAIVRFLYAHEARASKRPRK